MFGNLGTLASLLSKPQKIREEMDKLQGRLAQVTAEGQAGGGMVTVKVNGKCAVLSCRLSEEAMKLQDREMLEDLIAAATNQALDKARELIAAETQKMAAELGLPPGMSLPGLGG
jgi:DNA-binding YbaB/EbfC family protein